MGEDCLSWRRCQQCGRGGIGRRAGLRSLWRNPCGFESLRPHPIGIRRNRGGGRTHQDLHRPQRRPPTPPLHHGPRFQGTGPAKSLIHKPHRQTSAHGNAVNVRAFPLPELRFRSLVGMPRRGVRLGLASCLSCSFLPATLRRHEPAPLRRQPEAEAKLATAIPRWHTAHQWLRPITRQSMITPSTTRNGDRAINRVIHLSFYV